MSTFNMTDDEEQNMSGKESSMAEPKPLTCRRCEYATEVLRTSCPLCSGDMIYAPES